MNKIELQIIDRYLLILKNIFDQRYETNLFC